jgi:SAM-dependent methyltransferase
VAQAHGGSASIGAPDYWWYRVRSNLLRVVLEPFVGSPQRVLDVGSADGPSVSWLRGHGRRTALDLDTRGLGPGDVCASAMELPFRDDTFDVVSAFDVVEHCEPEIDVMSELARVLRPGGRLLISVPAYQWAWSDFDEQNGHHRRYTRPRAVASAEGVGLEVRRATYTFASTFPLFAAERLLRRLRHRLSGKSHEAADIVDLPHTSPLLERILVGLGALDARLLRGRDLPFGSSVVLVAVKPG